MNALQKTFAGVKRFYDGKFSTLYVVKVRDGQLCVWEPLFPGNIWKSSHHIDGFLCGQPG